MLYICNVFVSEFELYNVAMMMSLWLEEMRWFWVVACKWNMFNEVPKPQLGGMWEQEIC